MSDPFWRPATFISTRVGGDGSSDATYTVNPGDIAVITAVYGFTAGDGLFETQFLVTHGELDLYEIIRSDTGQAVIVPSLDIFEVCGPGDLIEATGAGGSLTAYMRVGVSGRIYAATQLAP